MDRSRFLHPALVVVLATLLVAAMPVSTPTPHDVDPASCRDIAPLAAEDGTLIERGVCNVPTFLQCDGAAPEQEPKVFVLPSLVSPTPYLGLDAPTESVTDGAGCGMLEPDGAIFGGTTQDTPYELTFHGAIEGNLDSVTVELHGINVDSSRLGEEMLSEIRLSFDGEPAFGTELITNVAGDVIESPRLVPITFVPEASSTQISTSFQITITNLDALDLGLADDAGYGANRTRQLMFTISHPRHPDNVVVPDVRSQRRPNGQYAWVWGTTEVPAGVDVNPSEIGEAGPAHVVLDAAAIASG